MGYRIEYGQMKEEDTGRQSSIPAFPLMLACAFAVFLLSVGIFYPEGTRWAKETFGPGASFLEAADTMAANLREGISVGDAVTAFCREIIEDAGFEG